MLNYMRAEVYKLLHRKYVPIFTLAILVCEGLLASGFIFTNAHGNDINFATGGGMAVMFFSIGLFLLLVVADMVFSDQNKHNTLKNEVSFGIPRTRIYLGKYLTALLLGVILMVLFVAFYVGLCWLTLIPCEPEQAKNTLIIVGYCLLAALPQWMGMLSLCFMFFFLLRSYVGAVFAYLGILVVPQQFFSLAALFLGSGSIWAKLESLAPAYLLDYASRSVGDWWYIGICWTSGVLWLLVTMTIGLTIFHKKEIS